MPDVNVNYSELRQALRDDKELFIEFLLGDEIENSVPEFHIAMLNDMCDKSLRRIALAVPRGHAKTTMAKLAVAWHLINDSDIEFIVYLSDTATLAIEACRDIMGFFASDNFVSVFGRIEYLVEQAGAGFYIFEIPSLNKTCTLKSQGRGKQVRGLNIRHRRPQLAVIDDLENEETANSEDQFAKMKTWLYGSFIKALNKGWNKVIHIGNIHGLRSQLHSHVISEYWASRLYGALLADGTPLWEDQWSWKALQNDLMMYQEQGLVGLWFAEMMNAPMVSEFALIKSDEITYMPPLVPGDSLMGFVTVDLALSKETWAHRTAVVVHLWNPHFDVWQVVELHTKRGMDITELYDVIASCLTKWRLSVCCIESYAYQGVVREIFRMLSIIKHPMNTFEFLPIHHGKMNKTAHIAAWAGLLKSTPSKAPSYALTKGDWICTQQLIRYDARKSDNDDDAIDACSYGPQVTMQYMGRIVRAIENGGVYDTARPQGTYEVCPV